MPEQLSQLISRTRLTLRWISPRRIVTGNERAERMSRTRGRLDRTNHPMFYGELTCRLKIWLPSLWMMRLSVGVGQDDLRCLEKPQEVIIFRQRKGHCRPQPHFHELKRSYYISECLCGTDRSTYVLRSCLPS